MAKFINVDSLLISPILPQVLSWMFAWLGQRYLWHIPQRDAEYSSEMIQQKEISFPDLEKQNKQKNMFDINAASLQHQSHSSINFWMFIGASYFVVIYMMWVSPSFLVL